MTGDKPVDQGAKVVSAASGGVRGNSRGGALIDAHLDAGPIEDQPLVAPHLGLTLWQAQHILPPMHLQHLFLDLQGAELITPASIISGNTAVLSLAQPYNK